MYTKNCPKCNSIMTYSKKSNLNKSLKNNSVCKKCVEWTDERKNKLRIARNNYLENLDENEKQNQINKMSNSLKQLWENKTDFELNDWKEKVSFTSKKRWNNEEYKNRLKKSIKRSWDNLSQEQKEIRIQKSLDNGAGICDFFSQNGYKVQGHSEKRYIQYLKQNNLSLPLIKNKKAVNTPLGLYFPDFEFEDYYVEIKSSYTFSKLINKLSYDGKKENKQLDKILWTSNNIKEVKIFIETKQNNFIEAKMKELALFKYRELHSI